MKKMNLKLDLDTYTEKAIRLFCKKNNLTFEKFIEEAVFEKLESSEIQEGAFVEEEGDDAFTPDDAENTLFESEEDLYKKKH